MCSIFQSFFKIKMDLIFLKNNINIQKYLVSRYFFEESIVSVSRYIFKSILQYSDYYTFCEILKKYRCNNGIMPLFTATVTCHSSPEMLLVPFGDL